MTRSTNDNAQFACKRFVNEVGDVQLKSLNFMDANRDQPQAKAKVIHNSLQANTDHMDGNQDQAHPKQK